MLKINLQLFGGRGAASQAGSAAAKIRQTLNAEENKIYKNNYETAVLIGADGSVTFRETQHDPSQVTFSPTQCAQMRGGVLTHNHPGGSTFSTQDVDILTGRDLNIIRATGREQTYQLEKTADNKRARRFAQDFDNAQKANKRKIDPTYDQAMSDYYAGKITATQVQKVVDDCNRRLRQANSGWLKNNAQSYGYKYSIIKRR